MAGREPEDTGDGTGGCSDFATVVRRHWASVYRLLYSLTGHVHRTEDLTQETFLRALRRIDSYQPGTGMRPWLLRIAANAFFDEQRRSKCVRMTALDADQPARHEAPGHAMETAEQAALAREALVHLTPLTRLVFHLRVEEELSFREIAELAGTTEQAARWHMRQARVKLLEHLTDERDFKIEQR